MTPPPSAAGTAPRCGACQIPGRAGWVSSPSRRQLIDDHERDGLQRGHNYASRPSDPAPGSESGPARIRRAHLGAGDAVMPPHPALCCVGHLYDALGDTRTSFRELEWTMPNFYGREVRNTPNASYECQQRSAHNDSAALVLAHRPATSSAPSVRTPARPAARRRARTRPGPLGAARSMPAVWRSAGRPTGRHTAPGAPSDRRPRRLRA